MLSTNRKESLYLLRELSLKLINIYGENQTVYFYYSNQYNEIVFISILKVDIMKDVQIGNMTLAELLIYTLVEEYPKVTLAQLVLVAYRIMRHYSFQQIASILSCAASQYERLETGFKVFKDNFSFEELSKKLNIPKEYFISEVYFSIKRKLESTHAR